MSYAETHAKWMHAPEQFWAEAAEDVFWYRRWDRVLDDSNPPFYRWFRGRDHEYLEDPKGEKIHKFDLSKFRARTIPFGSPVVTRLPKTRSGKMLRGTIKKIADSTPYRVPPTIDDPTTLDEMKGVLQNLGYAKNP